jgi:molybdopterin-guanine dinucleotide biosynthesis protein A
MIAPVDLTGLILAGGLATRMRASLADVSNGFQSDGAEPMEKGLLVLRGETLADRARRFLDPHVSRVLISANRQAERYAAYGHVVPDAPEYGDNAGPLAGVASALAHVATPWMAVIPVDVPLLPPDLLGRLGEAVCDEGVGLAYAGDGEGGIHPLCMLVHGDLLDDLHSYLLGGGRKVRLWHARQHGRLVRFDGPTEQFLNVNTAEDLERAERALA